MGDVIVLSLGILLVEYLYYHGFHVLTNLNEVLVEDALSLFLRLELIELRERDIL